MQVIGAGELAGASHDLGEHSRSIHEHWRLAGKQLAIPLDIRKNQSIVGRRHRNLFAAPARADQPGAIVRRINQIRKRAEMCCQQVAQRDAARAQAFLAHGKHVDNGVRHLAAIEQAHCTGSAQFVGKRRIRYGRVDFILSPGRRLIADGKATVVREVDGGLETVAVTLPAVISTDLRLNEPRYASLPNIMKAKKKPLDTLTPDALGVDVTPRLTTLRVAEPAKRVAGIKVADVGELVAKLKNEAKVI